MECYGGFAKVYDTFMDDIPYDEWAEYLFLLFEKFNINTKTVAELGCGTGNITKRLSDKGFKVIGVDYSKDMLNVAQSKAIKNVSYINQDILELELDNKQDLIVSLCDTMNYMTQEYDLLRALKSVYDNLNPGGYFIFDMKTIYYYNKVLGSRILTDNREDCSYIWENEFDITTGINSYDLTIFVKADDKYEKITEYHEQCGFSRKSIKKCIMMSGLNLVAEYEAFTTKKPGRKSERLYYVVRKEIV